MITFKQKSFSEFDAMRSLYMELNKNTGNRDKFPMIKLNSLLPILKGNNVVIERFVISTGLLKRDTYRMYLKIGAKAKMPDEVRLPQRVYDNNLLNATLNLGYDTRGDGSNDGGSNKEKTFTFKEKEFGDKNKNKPFTGMNTKLEFPVNIKYEVKELLGEAVNYDKRSRSLVLEFRTIQDAMRAINILPFGVNYKIYLLDINS